MQTITKTNALNWFELYTADFDRAKRFYSAILNAEITETVTDQYRMGMLPFEMNGGVGGCISQMEGFRPGIGGTLVYLNVEGDLDAVIERIPAAGGKIVRPRFAIPPHGSIALFEDTEGNLVGLHSMT